MPAPQNLKNHTRFDPVWHFFILPFALINIIFACMNIYRHWPDHPRVFGWWIVMSVVFFMAVGKARAHSLKVQDRVIRLEERLRLAALLPAADLARSQSLTESQLIGLRFASDGELPALVKRTLDQNLTQKQIKESIVTWKPDHFRV